MVHLIHKNFLVHRAMWTWSAIIRGVLAILHSSLPGTVREGIGDG